MANNNQTNEELLDEVFTRINKAVLLVSDTHSHVVNAPSPMSDLDHYSTQLYIEMLSEHLEVAQKALRQVLGEEDEESEQDEEADED